MNRQELSTDWRLIIEARTAVIITQQQPFQDKPSTQDQRFIPSGTVNEWSVLMLFLCSSREPERCLIGSSVKEHQEKERCDFGNDFKPLARSLSGIDQWSRPREDSSGQHESHLTTHQSRTESSSISRLALTRDRVVFVFVISFFSTSCLSTRIRTRTQTSRYAVNTWSVNPNRETNS